MPISGLSSEMPALMPRPSIIQVFEGHVLCFLIPTSFPYNRDRMRLDIDLAPNRKNNLSLRNPVLTASGTFGNGLEYVKLIDVETLGAIVSKAVTLKPRIGNRQPRLLETAAGMLNSIGLQNIGVKALIQDVAPIWATWSVPVIVNLAGETVSDYARLAYELDDVPGVSGLELNISCPNVESGLEFGTDPNLAAVVTKAVRRETALPLIVKLTPNTERIAEVAKSVTDEGADSLTVANTFPAMAIDADRQLPALGWGWGGLSGPALKPINLKLVYEIASVVNVPIIGCGGIMHGRDALDYLFAGATAVQVGTATFCNPGAALDILQELKKLLRSNDFGGVSEAVGVAKRERATL